MLYALVITMYGQVVVNGIVPDVFFSDVITYTTMEACEKDKLININAVQATHPTFRIRGACVVATVNEVSK